MPTTNVGLLRKFFFHLKVIQYKETKENLKRKKFKADCFVVHVTERILAFGKVRF